MNLLGLIALAPGKNNKFPSCLFGNAFPGLLLEHGGVSPQVKRLGQLCRGGYLLCACLNAVVFVTGKLRKFGDLPDKQREVINTAMYVDQVVFPLLCLCLLTVLCMLSGW